MKSIKLNSRQKAASEFLYGTACTIAIPGSGKTTVMSSRIGNLVKNHHAAPEEIVALTFTRNAAQSMVDRLKPILGDLAQRVTLSTIHSFCLKLLKKEGKVFEILHGTEQIRFIKQIMKEKRIKNIPTGMAIREISLSKNNLVTAEEFQVLYESDNTMQKIATIYQSYESEKKKRMYMDFNDLLSETNQLLSEQKEIREKYQSTFQHILVDEFQDTNPAQMAVLKQLTGKISGKRSLWVTGDEAQSIYGFMGASISNILHFHKEFPRCKQYILDCNYRSTPQILSACQKLIENNTKRIEKKLKTKNKSGQEVQIIEASNDEVEAIQVAEEIKFLVDHESLVWKDVSVLYRANCQSRNIEEIFTKEQIPYHIENGTSFYQRMEVKVLLDYLRLIENPDSDAGDEALKSVINKPTRYIGRKFLNELEEYAGDMHLYSALKDMPIQIPYLRKFIREFVAMIDPLIKEKMQPAELIHLLRESLDYDRYITDDDVPSPDSSVIENINQLQMVAGKHKDIKSLLNYADSFKEENSNNKNGVALMTIHKAKGLEFPVVFVIGMVEGVMPNTKGELEEERRICFTALSRAMKLLYLSYSTNYLGRSVKRSRFLDEILDK